MKKNYSFLFASFLAAFVNAQTLPQFCFKSLTYTTGLSQPRGITSGDFNGDGMVDLAAANQNANNISVLLGTGTGSFNTGVNYGVGSSPWGVASADFNADGNSDLAVANGGGNNISVLIATGTGSFLPAVNFTLSYSPREIISSDFNGDGNADLATAYFGGNNISIFLGNGTGGFGAPVNYSAGNSPWGLVSDDFNGDGNMDVATANSGGNNISVLFGTGLGNFSSVTNYSVGNSPQSIVSGDFNGDGNPDLAVADLGVFGGADVAVLLNTGNGSFGTASYYMGGTNAAGIASSDLNNDGISDLAVLDFGGSMLYLLAGSGTGSFTWLTNFSFPAGSKIISTDLNADGRSDLAATGAGSNRVSVLLNILPPAITVSTNATILCAGQSLSLTASGANSYAWSNNGIPASGNYTAGSSSVFIANTTSTYAVAGISSISGCTANAIAQVSVSACTDIVSNPWEELLTVFPNPATSIITFNLPADESVTIEIYNQVGQLISKVENSSGRTSYDVSVLGQAIYFYKITGKNKCYSGKFCKTPG